MEAEIGIILGARAVLSFVGLAIIFIGFWIKDRRWDELGALAYEKYKDLKGFSNSRNTLRKGSCSWPIIQSRLKNS